MQTAAHELGLGSIREVSFTLLGFDDDAGSPAVYDSLAARVSRVQVVQGPRHSLVPGVPGTRLYAGLGHTLVPGNPVSKLGTQ